MQRDLLLALARLTDPATTSGQANITLRAHVDAAAPHASPAQQADLEARMATTGDRDLLEVSPKALRKAGLSRLRILNPAATVRALS